MWLVLQRACHGLHSTVDMQFVLSSGDWALRVSSIVNVTADPPSARASISWQSLAYSPVHEEINQE